MSYPPDLYLGSDGEVSAAFRPVTAPPDLTIGTRSRVSHLATGATTDGHYGLYRWEMSGDRRPVPDGHYHRTFSESFYILEGSVGLYDGATWRESTAGDFFYAPPGGVHAFDNTSGEPATMLVLFAPGAPREAFFQELADIVAAGRVLSPEEWTELYARHDQYMV